MATISRRPLAISLAVAIPAIAIVFLWPRLFPVDDPADFETRQTARVMTALWAMAMACRIRLGRTAVARAWWVAACLAFVVHVATAFDRIHGWSHGRAFDHVAETSGFGPGVFVSYSFTLLWILDAAWWCVDPAGYAARSRRLELGLHGFFAFIMFNGTVVYETGLIRWAGLAIFAGLGLLLRMAPRRQAEPGPDGPG